MKLGGICCPSMGLTTLPDVPSLRAFLRTRVMGGQSMVGGSGEHSIMERTEELCGGEGWVHFMVGRVENSLTGKRMGRTP